MRKEKLEDIYAGVGLLERPLYAISEAARYLLVPEGTLRKWVGGRDYSLKDGTPRRSEQVIETPEPGLLSFLNLAEAHVLSTLRREFQLSLPQVKRAVDYLREHSATKYPLAQQKLLTVGKDIVVEAFNDAADGHAHLVNASRFGQLELRPIVEVHLRRLEGNVDGFFARFYPFTRTLAPSRAADQPKLVVIDPKRGFGKPILATSGVSTAAIASRWKAGESVNELAEDYGELPARIEEALRCEVIDAAA